MEPTLFTVRAITSPRSAAHVARLGIGGNVNPKIVDLLFKDDRMFVLEVIPVTTRSLTSSASEKQEWAVITRRNVPGYPLHRSDTFPSRTEAIEYYKKVVVETPRVSLGNKSPVPPPSLEAYVSWLVAENVYDPLLNPNVPVKPDP